MVYADAIIIRKKIIKKRLITLMIRLCSAIFLSCGRPREQSAMINAAGVRIGMNKPSIANVRAVTTSDEGGRVSAVPYMGRKNGAASGGVEAKM